MNFVNRDAEREFLKKSIDEKNQLIYFNSDPASGISAFLEKCETEFDDQYVFLLDAIENPNFAKNFCDKACKNMDLRNTIQSIANTELGEKSQTFMSALLKSSPYCGELLSYITERPSIPFVYTGAFSSIYEEVAISTINKLRLQKKVIFLIDNAKFLSESSRKMCQQLICKLNIYFVFALEKNTIETQKFENGFNSSINQLMFKPIKYEFSHPDTKMIQLLSEMYHINCSTEEAEYIANITRDNIHSIIGYLLNYNESKNLQLNYVQKIIINILYEINNIISFNILLDIIEHLKSEELLSKEIIEVEIDNLKSLRIIEQKDNILSLVSLNHPKVVDSLNDWVLTISIKSAILETFYESKIYQTNENYLKTSYQIALYFHDNRYITFSKDLLKNAVITGTQINEDLLDICKNNSNSEEDSLIVVLYLTQSRRYLEALNIIEKSIKTINIKPLHAALLNRCRKHEKAEEELKLAISNETHKDIALILYAYLIGNYVHSNKSHKAKQVFNSINPLNKDLPEYAYVLRNIATVYPPDKAAKYSHEASRLFNNNHNSFGEFSAKCNEYRFLCEQGNYAEALAKMMSVLESTIICKSSHMHILLNNIAICNIYLKKITEAEFYLQSALRISNANMPIIFLKINYSSLLLLKGNAIKSLEIIESIKDLVLTYPVDRVRQRYFINYCHILYANNKNYDNELEKAKEFMDRVQPNRTKKLCEFYKEAANNNRIYKKEDFKELFIPCYLEYWYTEPLKLISSDIINNILSFHTGENDITNQILV